MLEGKGIFVPWNVPLKRRLETAAVFYYIFMFLIAPVPSVIIPLYLIFYTSFWWLPIIYFAWMVYDHRTSFQGGRPSESIRNQRVWKYFANYFPIKLVKTAELPPNRNYIFGSHPHGIISIGNFASICTNGTGFDKAFPGLQRVIVTLRCMFYFPIRRELVIGFGAISSEASSIENVLKTFDKKGKIGHAVSIVLGGAEEALDSHPDNFDLKLNTRRGFARLALRHGASLVPVYHFGETSLYHQFKNERGSPLRNFQIAFKNLFGISPPLFIGRGIFNYVFGFLPYRVPINSVFGAPIDVKRCDGEPKNEEVNKLHAKYCKALTKLFDTHKINYGISASAKLNIY